jgi:Zn-dependent peptidase ImmA (M78 family)/DNA-binding XRE family transcriptional regulator
MEAEFNGNMLKIARKSKGFSQDEICERVGITQGAFSKIEKGLLAPSTEVVSALSIELGVLKEFFFQDGRVFQPVTPYNRSRASLQVKTKDRLEAVANLYRIHLAKLMDEIELSYNITRIDLLNQSAAEAAELTRRNLRVPRGPIDNLTNLMEDNGLFAIFFDFETKALDGFTIQTSDIIPIVFINNQFPGDRIRFTLAHELGHIVMHNHLDGESNVEQEANDFASEFLMPRADIIRELADLSLEKLANLKLKWKVSMGALIQRAKALKTITENQARYLWMQMSSRGFRTKEPVDIPTEKSTLLKELIATYFNDLGYSRRDLSSLLLIHENELDIYFNFGRFKLKVLKPNNSRADLQTEDV